MTGISRGLKEKDPNIKIVSIEPCGSSIAPPEKLDKPDPKGTWVAEGTGKDYVPRVLDRDIADYWVRVSCKDSFNMSRRILREEGMFIGSTSG